MYHQPLNTLHKIIKTFLFATVSFLIAIPALAIDTAIVKINDLFISTMSESISRSSKEVTQIDYKKKIDSFGVSDYDYRLYATLQDNGTVKIQVNLDCVIWGGLDITHASKTTYLAMGQKKNISVECDAEVDSTAVVRVKVEIARGNKEIVCSSSLISGFTISENPGLTRTYFSTAAQLTSSTLNTCTYKGNITTKYSVPGASGTSTVANATYTFPLKKVGVLRDR